MVYLNSNLLRTNTNFTWRYPYPRKPFIWRQDNKVQLYVNKETLIVLIFKIYGTNLYILKGIYIY